MAELIFYIDPEEIFFHVSSGLMNINVADPWDYSIHDFYTISTFWIKHPPIHLVAASMVKSNSEDGEEAPRRTTKKMDKEGMYHDTLLGMEQNVNLLTGTKPDQKQADRLAKMFDTMDRLNEGKTFAQIVKEKREEHGRKQ